MADRAVALYRRTGVCLAVASVHRRVAVRGGHVPGAGAAADGRSAVHSVSFSPRGTLAAGLDNGRVELREVETGERIGTLWHADRGEVTVVFSPDGSRLASGSWDQVIRVWDVATRVQLATWEVVRERNGRRGSISFSPDGLRMVSGFDDGTVRLWDMATQAEVAILKGHTREFHRWRIRPRETALRPQAPTEMAR